MNVDKIKVVVFIYNNSQPVVSWYLKQSLGHLCNDNTIIKIFIIYITDVKYIIYGDIGKSF